MKMTVKEFEGKIMRDVVPNIGAQYEYSLPSERYDLKEDQPIGGREAIIYNKHNKIVLKTYWQEDGQLKSSPGPNVHLSVIV
jgi:hypothetical protein